jgi:peptide/nickel transport system permease protein
MFLCLKHKFSRSEREERKEKTMFRWIKWISKSKKAMIGSSLLLVICIFIIFAPYISPFDPYKMNPDKIASPPDSVNIMGTDAYGRDVFSRVLYGGRASFGLALIIVIVSFSIGIILGILAGYFGSWVDMLIMRLVDIIFSLPWILISLCVAAIMGPGIHVIIIALGTIYSMEVVKLVRGVVLSVREEEYVEAAIITGESRLFVMIKHILPNCIAPIIVQSSYIISIAILGEAAISYLGLGIQPPNPSWGVMLQDGGHWVYRAPYLPIFPGVSIGISVLSINLLGDGLRDLLDPKFAGVVRSN